jgi:hypothetical protein
MITFDSPQRNVCTSRRIRTNTPLQALTTLNDTVYYAAAENIANKILTKKTNNLNEKIDFANQLIFQKPATGSKKAVLAKFYNETLADFKKKKNAKAEFLSLTMLANTLMNTDEFLTK